MPAFAAACFVFPTVAPADVRISEFMADNDSFLADADGDYEDWIEIHNAGPGAVNLAGYTLSDDAADPGKWAFPAVALPEGGYLLVFASGKDRAQAGAELHTNFKLDRSDDYLGLFPPGGGAALTEFAPFFPPQRKNLTYGEGYAGAVTETDLTPPAQVAGTTYARAKITGAGAVSADGSLNSFDDSLGDPEHQQYQWYDYSAQLALIPAGHTVVSAVLQRAGEARLVAGASGLSCVDSRIGVFAAPSVNMGAAAIAGKRGRHGPDRFLCGQRSGFLGAGAGGRIRIVSLGHHASGTAPGIPIPPTGCAGSLSWSTKSSRAGSRGTKTRQVRR
ncbi:MAG: lamin tail domain-containing protein [Verrucomicrobiales bacterium]